MKYNLFEGNYLPITNCHVFSPLNKKTELNTCTISSYDSWRWFVTNNYCIRKKNEMISIGMYHHHHHNHVMLSAQISLTLSRHPSLSSIASGRSSGQHTVSAQSCCSNWSPCLWSSIWRCPQVYITYELVPTSPAVSRISSSSNLDSFHDEW